MTKLRAYCVTLNDDQNIFNVTIVAKSKKDAKLQTKGNGTVIGVSDITKSFPLDVAFVYDLDLSETQRDILRRLLGLYANSHFQYPL